MGNEIEIKKNDIDWLKIINLAFKRKDWGKTYCLYSYGKVNINCVMKSFDFERSIAMFKISVNYMYEDYVYQGNEYENYAFVEYFINNFTIDDFKTIINKRIKRLLNEILEAQLKTKAQQEYLDLKVYSWRMNLDKEVKKLGLEKDYNKILSLTDLDIKEEILERFKDKVNKLVNKEYDLKVNEYIKYNSVNIPYFDNILSELEKD